MVRRVAIVAQAQTRFESSKPALNNGELIWEVVEKVRQQTGLSYRDQGADGIAIDKIISCSEDYWQGRTISDALLQQEMGGYGLDSTKVAADGAQAVYHAVLNILSGHYDVVLVVAHRKESETVGSIIENNAFDPIYLRPLGLDFLAAAALQARQYMHKYGITEEQCARVVVKNRRNAGNNPYAQEALSLSVDDVLGSRMLAEPIKLLDCKPTSDGACALILAAEEAARQISNNLVWIRGIGNCYDAHYLGDRDLAEAESLVLAAKRAYDMAGIADPLREIQVAEIADEYSYQELLWLEGLGLCQGGEAGSLVDSGVTDMKGELPVNPSGGMLSGNPSGVAGIVRVAEAFLQLSGQAGARQVAGAKTALAHGATGPCGQSHCVIILGT